MITPQNAAEMVLTYHTHDAQHVSSMVLAAINAAGYVILNRNDYLNFLSKCAEFALDNELPLFRPTL